MAREIRLGVVGLGRAAANMIPALAAHPHVKMTGAADPIPAARARWESDFGGPTFEHAEALCASGTVDAIYIATPHGLHVSDVVTAAAHGIHTIVEKPMALSLDECDAMIAAVERAGTALVVGHTHAFDPPTRMIRDIVASGEAGALRAMVNVVSTDFLYRPRRPEELDTALGGGILFNQVPHSLEIVREIDGGPLRTVRAVTGIYDPARKTEGALSAFLEFASGAVAQLTYNGYDFFDSDELAFWISEGGAEKRPSHGATRRKLAGIDTATEIERRRSSGYAGTGAGRGVTATHYPHFGFLLVSCERADLRPSADGVLIYDENGVREIRGRAPRVYPDKDNVIDEFYAAIVDGTAPRHDARWGKATMAAALALQQSARERREIALG